jgi:hypothetical protein
LVARKRGHSIDDALGTINGNSITAIEEDGIFDVRI